MTSDIRYTSQVHITRSAGPDRLAVLPTGETVTFGVHGGISAHYGIEMAEGEGRAATLDYLVAATAAALVGTFARTLKDEGIVVGAGDLQADAFGNFSEEDGELVLTDIEVVYTLRAADDLDLGAIGRAEGRHMPMCPLVKTLGRCVEITTSVTIVNPD